MKDWRGVLIGCVAFLGSGYYVINLARQGEIVGWVIIVGAIFAFLLLIVLGIVLIMQRAQRESFSANTQENLALMSKMQSLQNAQMTGLARSFRVEQAAQKGLPPPEQSPALIFADDAFAELYDE